MPVISYNVSNDSPIKKRLYITQCDYCTVLRTLTHSKFRPNIHWPINRMQWPTACKKTLNVSADATVIFCTQTLQPLVEVPHTILNTSRLQSSTVVTEKSRRCFSRVVTKHFDDQPHRRAWLLTISISLTTTTNETWQCLCCFYKAWRLN